MGMKMHYFPEFYSMRDLNDNSRTSWPFSYGDNMVANRDYYNGFVSTTRVDNYPRHERDTLKQKMLQHEAVFKNQVLELHRLYRIQRDMMEDFKKRDRASTEPASSSSLQRPSFPSHEARKWHMAGFPLLADLNEPIRSEEASTPSSIDFLGRASENGKNADCQPDKSPLYSSGYNREDKSIAAFQNGLESSRRLYSHSNNSQLKPLPCFHYLSSSNRGSGNEPKSNGLHHANSKPVIDINLNEELPNSLQDLNMEYEKGKPEHDLSCLPWLKPISIHPDRITDTRKLELNKLSTSRMIDINVACEPDEHVAIEEPNMEKEIKKKGWFDLNFCISDSEDPSPHTVKMEIDLEASIPMETEDDIHSTKMKEKKTLDGVSRDAAETLLAISSFDAKDSLGESLLWLVNAIHEEVYQLDKKSQDESIDEFEATALQLIETRPEDYLPEPYLHKLEERETRPRQTRTRRGQARRGRNFQRDTLPGLASLSRHEVAEDIRIFGGMMRATGHSWSSKLTRRNGGGGGRRRAVVEAAPPRVCSPLVEKLSSIEGGLEGRSVIGWGKMRRPRQQRCPAGNPTTTATTNTTVVLA